MGWPCGLYPGPKEPCLRLESHMVLVQFLALTPTCPQVGRKLGIRDEEGRTPRVTHGPLRK